MMKKNIEKLFAAFIIIEILFEQGLVGEATYKNVQSKYSRIST